MVQSEFKTPSSERNDFDIGPLPDHSWTEFHLADVLGHWGDIGSQPVCIPPLEGYESLHDQDRIEPCLTIPLANKVPTLNYNNGLRFFRLLAHVSLKKVLP